MHARLPTARFFYNSAFYPLAAALLGGAALSSCGGPDKTTEKTTAAASKTPVAAISQVSVFVDASTGMRGFMHPNAPGETGSQFQRSITELLSNINDQRAVNQTAPSYYFVQESTAKDPRTLRPTTYAELSNTVSEGIKNPALGTEMPTMLRDILKLQKSKPGTVSVVISDFIYAPPDPKQTWKVKTDVKDALNEASAQDLAISIFAGTSEFRDKFFPGNRTHFQVLHGSRLPYYVWVLGQPAAVAAAMPWLKPLMGADFERVSFNTPAPPAAVFEHFGNVGEWYADKTGSRQTQPLTLHFTKSLSRQEPAEFVLGLDLTNAPTTEAASLPTKLQLDEAGTGATLAKVWTARDEPKAPSTPALATYTHLARVHLERLPGRKPATVRLVLPRTQPAWVTKYTTLNDSNIAAQGPKTFLLSEVLQGVQDYYDQTPAGREVWALPVQLQPAD
ncbi:hypothetical protein GKZ68_15465 [Hymenobacter sp. BRD128]|uniref:hypothetical protein n=1 Tax=Hymenobacter sp. BRD128 TaxID=2675878 RepID=UPI001562F54C|nr:hypothetical protein [Hymenobacter sp. BRD128]QKG57902.1 hypothetical protein GKZ68_15465 [Hymenobacter sp. BRD128]